MTTGNASLMKRYDTMEERAIEEELRESEGMWQV